MVHMYIQYIGAQSTELVSLYIGYWTLNNYYYYYITLSISIFILLTILLGSIAKTRIYHLPFDYAAPNLIPDLPLSNQTSLSFLHAGIM